MGDKMDKEQAKEELKSLIKQYSEGERYWGEQSESDIGFHFIEPLFEKVLGWNKLDITKEERVFKKRADYIMRIGNKDSLVVEAKKTGISLTDEEGRQAVSYAYHKKIKFAVLTNFKNLIVYHALSNIKNIGKNQLKVNNSYFRLNFTELLDKFDTLWLLSRDSFEKGEINKLLSTKDVRFYKPIDENILEDLLKIRKWLSTELKSKKNYLEDGKIDEIVQILIDRLIFIRSVEDRGLEKKNYLKITESEVRNQDVKLQLLPYLLEKFTYFNETYDSKLFEPGLLEKEGAFSDEILRKVILALYSGTSGEQEDYQFDKIPGDLLGSIYEQYLGTILQGTEKRVKLEQESGKRKKMGIYYTPSYIVDYIVKNTVGEYIKDKSIDEILNVKIVDPACGSGSFLIRAFEEVCNGIEERLKKGEKGKMATFQSYKERLSFSQKISILTQCIHGVDLDEKAVELAQLNLLLKLLEDETPESHKRLLPNLRDNIKCGNSLIDDSSVAGDKAFKWEAQFPDVFRQGGFDIVVGNPPYFKIHEEDPIKKTEIFNEIKSGMMNISAVFINKALYIMKKEGYVGMIVPKMLAFTESWEKIRSKILKNTSLKNVVDAGKAFDDVLLEQIIFCLSGKISKNNQIVIGQIQENNIIKETATIENDLCSKDNKIYLEPEKLAYSIKNKMESGNLRLGDVSEIFLGLGIQGMNNFVEKSKPEYKKALGGNDIQRWKIRGCWYYNEKDKELLKYKKQMEKFYRPKIVAQRIVAHIRDHIKITAALDEEGLFTFNTVTNFIIKDKNYSTPFILLLLNSKLIQYYTYKFIYQNAIRSMDFYEAYAKQIPIPKADKKLQDKLTSLASDSVNLNKKISESKMSGNEKERLEQQIKNLDYEIDQEVYKLYGITKEEQKLIEESLK